MNKTKVQYTEYPEFLDYIKAVCVVALATSSLTLNYINKALEKEGYANIDIYEITLKYFDVKRFGWEKHISSSKPYSEEVKIIFSYEMFSDIRAILFSKLKEITSLSGDIPIVLYPPELGSNIRRGKESIEHEVCKYSNYSKLVLKYFDTPRFTHPNLDDKNAKDTYVKPETKRNKVFLYPESDSCKPKWSRYYSKKEARVILGDISPATFNEILAEYSDYVKEHNRENIRFDMNCEEFQIFERIEIEKNS